MVTQNTSFDMAQLGRAIASNRKTLNLTQSSLAEALGVTHQAVSSWENGLTSPDISKLADLSQIFKISIDDLLGNHRIANIIHKIAQEDTLEESELVDIASMVKPDQLHDILDTFERSTISFDALILLLPFVDDVFIDTWLAKKQDTLDIQTLAPILPFLNERQIDSILSQHKNDTLNDLHELFPFLNDRQISAVLLSSREDIKELINLAPFMSDENFEQIYEGHLKDQSITDYRFLMPFFPDSIIKAITNKFIESNDFKNTEDIAPFMSEALLDQCIERMMDNAQFDLLDTEPLLPFLSQKTILKLFNYAVTKEVNSSALQAFL